MKNDHSDYHALILAPHCDDEVLGCGGAISNRIDKKVFVYYFGVEDYHVVSKEDRLKEVESVSKFLNFDYYVSVNKVNDYNEVSLVKEITNAINKFKPLEIFIPNKAYNQDHVKIFDAAMIALRPHDVNHFVPKVFVYEVDQYKSWGNHPWNPNYFEKIDIKKKIDAYKLHKSQVRSMRPPESLEHYAATYGLSANCDFAESFTILRYIL